MWLWLHPSQMVSGIGFNHLGKVSHASTTKTAQIRQRNIASFYIFLNRPCVLSLSLEQHEKAVLELCRTIQAMSIHGMHGHPFTSVLTLPAHYSQWCGRRPKWQRPATPLQMPTTAVAGRHHIEIA